MESFIILLNSIKIEYLFQKKKKYKISRIIDYREGDF